MLLSLLKSHLKHISPPYVWLYYAFTISEHECKAPFLNAISSSSRSCLLASLPEKKKGEKKKKQSEDDRTKRENNNELGRKSHICLNHTLSWLHSEMIPSGMYSRYSSNHVYLKHWPFTVMLWDFWKLAGFKTTLIRSQLMEMYSLTFMPLKGCFSALLWHSHPDISLLNLSYLFSNDSYLVFLT